MKFLESKRTPTINKLKKLTENLLLNGILIKILIIVNRLNKSLDKSHKPMKYSLIKKKEKIMISMAMKDLYLKVLQDLEDISLTSMMQKIFLDTFLNKIHFKMTFSVDSLEEIRQKRVLLQKQIVEGLVHLIMIHFFLEGLEVVLEDLVWDFLELTLYLMMMTFSQIRRRISL